MPLGPLHLRYHQDFPLKRGAWRHLASVDDKHAYLAAAKPSDFETQLSTYLSFLRLPTNEALTVLEICANHDFSAARGALVTTVPGAHPRSEATSSL